MDDQASPAADYSLHVSLGDGKFWRSQPHGARDGTRELYRPQQERVKWLEQNNFVSWVQQRKK